MSPELFRPEEFGLKDSRRTERSDCYALGMVIYEVLSGKVPFSRHEVYAVVVKVLDGERPERPQGARGTRFTDDIWRILEHCWTPQPGNRPDIEDVLRCLEEVSSSWTPLPPRILAVPPTAGLLAWGFSDVATVESMDGSGMSSPSQSGLSRPSEKLDPDGSVGIVNRVG